MGYETLLEQIKAVCAWNSLNAIYCNTLATNSQFYVKHNCSGFRTGKIIYISINVHPCVHLMGNKICLLPNKGYSSTMAACWVQHTNGLLPVIGQNKIITNIISMSHKHTSNHKTGSVANRWPGRRCAQLWVRTVAADTCQSNVSLH